ncbi:LysR family transcriptional regulator [Blautia sp. RD014234]|nr:LysR family transcriptional regulator [Blautia parvula]
MELRVLRYFLTAVNEGNITRAADILHVTQPTLSRQLIELENELGATLLIRGKRSLTLTDDGMLFKQQAEEIVELADKAEQTFTGKNEAISGVISLGASEALGGRVLARYMKQFLKNIRMSDSIYITRWLTISKTNWKKGCWIWACCWNRLIPKI